MPLPRPVLALSATALLAAMLLVAALLPRATAVSDPRLELPPLQAPGEWFDAQRAVGVQATDYAAALEESAALAAATARRNPEVAELEWELLGPTSIGGRIVDLALVEGRPNELYAAAASGGVWHSSDFGATFTRAWPDDLTQAIGAMTSGNGMLYVGTGEANPGGGSIVYGGTGLYRRSLEEGAEWELVGLEDAGAFGRIVVDPHDPDTVWAAASGNLFDLDGDGRGLWRSTKRGDPGTWELVLEGANPTTGAVDVAIHPTEPDRILVAMWDHYRTPEKRVYAGPGSGLWLSQDGGETWDQLDEITLPADPNPSDEYSLEDEIGRIGVAFAESDPDRAYAIIANTLDGTHGAWFRSDDGGLSFQEKAATGLAANNSSYGWWFARIFVDPRNADHLYVAGLELIESFDGGGTFLTQSNYLVGVASGLQQGNVHADQHAMVWSEEVPGLVYVGNDGGVYRSDANGAVGTWVGGVQQGWTQHYSVDVDSQTASYIVSGLQDNMCQEHVGGTEEASDAWVKFGLCGDGIVTRVDPADPSITYWCSQYGGCGRALAGVPDLRFAMPRDRYGWLADIQFDPTDSAILFTAGARLWRSTNRGQGWTPLSGPLHSPDLEQEDPNPGYRLRGVVTTIAVASNGRTVWAGTDEGRLWLHEDVTTANGSNAGWKLIGDSDGDGFVDASDELGLPERTWITSVAVDPADPSTAYVAYSGFRQNDDDAKLFVTRDGGESFSSLSGDLPSAPINDVILAGERLVVGTDVGVFMSTDGEGEWLRVGDLPAVPVTQVRYHAGTNTITAATFGHGIQRVTLPSELAPGLSLAAAATGAGL